jgi:hypothetical protein
MSALHVVPLVEVAAIPLPVASQGTVADEE